MPINEVPLPRPGDVEHLINIQKQAQGSSQNEETKKYGPNKEPDKTLEKELNEMEISRVQHTCNKDGQ